MFALCVHRCYQRSARLLVARRQKSSSPVSPPLLSRLLRFLTQHFYDVEMLLNWRSQLGRNRLQKKNVYYAYTHTLYGPDIASAHYILCLGGGFRFVGHSDWFRANKRGKFSWDFLNHKDTPLEEVDLSHTVTNYNGLFNLEHQHHLRTLKLQGCPEVDDWFLTKLHVFQDSLEELDISHCPLVTTGGLATLKNLKRLKHLNVSSLPRLLNPGLVIILLEEMLPHCQITADGYGHSLRPADEVCVEEERVQGQQL
uniref:Distal membrane-arm assembly complex protein 2 n=1 Tax=Nothobranchius rachovii TaxID=451742 RepID=A0A1A8P454_9TELE